MRVTLINHSDVRGGASVTAFRLMEALRALGVDAQMLVVSRESASPYVVQAAPHWRSRIPFYAEHLGIFATNGFSRSRLFQVSTASAGLPLAEHPLVRDADAVILNWVNQGMLSLGEIEKIAQSKPTLWTMHDQWNYTAICHHSGTCERFVTQCRDCPFLGWMAGKHDLAARVFARKQRLYQSTGITFVAVSHWLATRARSSVLLADACIDVIPNIISPAYFAAPLKPRAYFWLPDDVKLVAVCAARLDDPCKGLTETIALLNGIHERRSDTMAVLIGKIKHPHALDGLKMPYRWTGPLPQDDIPSVMAHASVVLSTSPAESWGSVLAEGQGAGATPVCYTDDGRADIVTDGVSGYALTRNLDADIDILNHALDHPIAHEKLAEAANRFSAIEVARRYMALLEAGHLAVD